MSRPKDFWSHENVVMLIQLYESRKLLWDTTDNDYKNKFKRKDCYMSIATELGVNNVDEVKKKIESLLVQFRREKKDVIPKSGMGTYEKKKAWWGLPYFKFLGDKHTPRSTVSSMTQEDISEIPEPFNDNEELSLSSEIPSPMDSSTLRSSTLLKSASVTQGSRSGSGISKRGVKRRQVDDAYNIMKSCFDDIQQESKLIKDEHSVYGENVANRIRKIKNPMRMCMLKNKIDNIIFEAEMKDFEEYGKEMENPESKRMTFEERDGEEVEVVSDISSIIGTYVIDLPSDPPIFENL